MVKKQLVRPHLRYISPVAAAVRTGGTTSSGAEIVSPELVLVDPALAVEARQLLADSADTRSSVTRPSDDAESPRIPAPDTAPPQRPDDTSAEARLRLMEHGLDSEVLGSLVPSGKHFRRRATLIPAAAAATAVALFVVQLYLNQGKLG